MAYELILKYEGEETFWNEYETLQDLSDELDRLKNIKDLKYTEAEWRYIDE